MKTAEEWRNSRYFGNNSKEGIETIIQAIQLDAWRQGMTDAADRQRKSDLARGISKSMDAKRILTARDKRKEI